MDIRTRLLLAFTPILLVVVALGLLSVLFATLAAEGIAIQRERTDDLIETQEIILAIFLEHDITGHIATGEEPADSPRYDQARATVEALLAAETGEPATAIDDDAAIRAEYEALAELHDEVVAAARAGDSAGAQARFERPEVDTTLDRIITLGADLAAATRATIAASDAEAAAASARIGPIVVFVLAAGGLLALGLVWLLIRQIVQPLNRLADDAERFAAGNFAGELSPAGNISQMHRLRDSFQQLIDANSRRQTQLQSALDALKQQVNREEHLRDTVQALSLPVVPLNEHTLLLPLVGYLDERRANELTRGLLAAIQTRRARSVVLDLTGLAALDRETAERLRQTADAARLLGCRVTLVGVRADQALVLSELEISTSGIEIARDIPAVLRNANSA